MVKPACRGRQKVEIKKIENRTKLGVTFTKRRNGIFKKANELVALCGATIAIVVFSPGKKAYSFGHPNIFAVLNCFLHGLVNNQRTFFGNQFSNYSATINQVFLECQNKNVDNLYSQHHEVQELVDLERKKSKEEKQDAREMPSPDELSLSGALFLRDMLQEFKGRISSELKRRVVAISMDRGGGNYNNSFVGDNLQAVSNFFDGATGPSNVPGPNYGPWN